MFTLLHFGIYCVGNWSLKSVWTPCNINKDLRILKYDYNHGLKNFKSIVFAPKTHKEIN